MESGPLGVKPQEQQGRETGCIPCGGRKMKCTGERPHCQTSIGRHKTCYYPAEQFFLADLCTAAYVGASMNQTLPEHLSYVNLAEYINKTSAAAAGNQQVGTRKEALKLGLQRMPTTRLPLVGVPNVRMQGSCAPESTYIKAALTELQRCEEFRHHNLLDSELDLNDAGALLCGVVLQRNCLNLPGDWTDISLPLLLFKATCIHVFSEQMYSFSFSVQCCIAAHMGLAHWGDQTTTLDENYIVDYVRWTVLLFSEAQFNERGIHAMSLPTPLSKYSIWTFPLAGERKETEVAATAAFQRWQGWNARIFQRETYPPGPHIETNAIVGLLCGSHARRLGLQLPNNLKDDLMPELLHGALEEDERRAHLHERKSSQPLAWVGLCQNFQGTFELLPRAARYCAGTTLK